MTNVSDLNYDKIISELRKIKETEIQLEKIVYLKSYDTMEHALRESRNDLEVKLGRLLAYEKLKELELFGIKRGSRPISDFCGYTKEELGK